MKFIIFSIIYWYIGIQFLKNYFETKVISNIEEIPIKAKITQKKTISNSDKPKELDNNGIAKFKKQYLVMIYYNKSIYTIDNFQLYMNYKIGDILDFNLVSIYKKDKLIKQTINIPYSIK